MEQEGFPQTLTLNLQQIIKCLKWLILMNRTGVHLFLTIYCSLTKNVCTSVSPIHGIGAVVMEEIGTVGLKEEQTSTYFI